MPVYSLVYIIVYIGALPIYKDIAANYKAIPALCDYMYDINEK